MPGFGRRFAPDDRDRNFLMRRMLADARSLALPPRKTWSIGSTALNQGNTGTCVGHAWRNFLRCAPIRTERGGPSAFDVYRSAVLKDPWRGQRRRGPAPGWRPGHGYGYDDPRRCRGRHRLRASPVVCVGVRPAAGRRVGAHDRPRRARYQLVLEPFTTGRRGRGTDHRQRPGGRRSCVSLARGGYAARSRALLEFVGRRLGQSGDFKVPFRDLERLIHEDGEVCSAVEQRLRPHAVMPPQAKAFVAGSQAKGKKRSRQGRARGKSKRSANR